MCCCGFGLRYKGATDGQALVPMMLNVEEEAWCRCRVFFMRGEIEVSLPVTTRSTVNNERTTENSDRRSSLGEAGFLIYFQTGGGGQP